MLAMGALLALVINFIQFLFYVKQLADDNDVPFAEEFKEEFRFVCKFGEMTKEVRHRKPSSSSVHSSLKHSNSAAHSLGVEATPKRDLEKSDEERM